MTTEPTSPAPRSVEDMRADFRARALAGQPLTEEEIAAALEALRAGRFAAATSSAKGRKARDKTELSDEKLDAILGL